MRRSTLLVPRVADAMVIVIISVIVVAVVTAFEYLRDGTYSCYCYYFSKMSGKPIYIAIVMHIMRSLCLIIIA